MAHWLEALTKHSNLWSNIDGEHKSLITTNNDKVKSIKDKIVIPLQENDILNCPFECLKPDNETIKIFKNKKQFKEFLRTNNIDNYPQGVE